MEKDITNTSPRRKHSLVAFEGLRAYSVSMEIKISTAPVEYPHALSLMEERVAGIHAGNAPEMLWLLEHPPLYTAGTSAKPGDLLDARFPVYETGRGGQHTYHGPGQRVGYTMLDLKTRQEQPDIRKFVWGLEEWIIKSLKHFSIDGERREGRVGIWVADGNSESKIAAIGVRVRHWITYHGISVNLDPDLSHFSGIVPCGINSFGVTSINKILDRDVTMGELDNALIAEWHGVFGNQRKAE